MFCFSLSLFKPKKTVKPSIKLPEGIIDIGEENLKRQTAGQSWKEAKSY